MKDACLAANMDISDKYRSLSCFLYSLWSQLCALKHVYLHDCSIA